MREPQPSRGGTQRDRRTQQSSVPRFCQVADKGNSARTEKGKSMSTPTTTRTRKPANLAADFTTVTDANGPKITRTPAAAVTDPKTATTTDATPAAAVTGEYSAMTLAKLENLATRQVSIASKAGVALAAILTELYVRQAWTEHGQSVVDYFSATIGVGESGVTLSKPARQEVVKRMAAVAPDAPIAHLSIITGASLRTISRDREEYDLANPARVASHKTAGDGSDDNDTDNAGDDKPTKASKTRVTTVNVIEIVDGLSDAAMLTAIMTHAAARLAELNASATATDKAA